MVRACAYKEWEIDMKEIVGTVSNLYMLEGVWVCVCVRERETLEKDTQTLYLK